MKLTTRVQRLASHLGSNPLALIIFGAFLLAEYGNWQHEVQIDHLCAVIEPADIIIYNHPTTRLQEAQRICAAGGSALPDWWPADDE